MPCSKHNLRTIARRHGGADHGQATAEYGLVMLAAASLAGALLAWASSSGGVGRLMDAVMDSLIGGIGGP